MTRENGGVVGQVEKAFFYALSECFKTSAGEIGAPDAAVEERIAGEDPTLDFGVKADATISMTRRTDNLQGALPHFDDFAIFQVSVGQLAVAVERQTEEVRLAFRTLEIAFHVRVSRRWNAIAFLDGSVAKDMVDVAMCVDDHQRFESMAVDEAEELVFLARVGAAWVDDDAIFGIVVVYDISIFRERIENKLFEFEHNYRFSGQR